MNISLTNKHIFSNTTCSLGEGLVWHPQRQSLFWLDIIEKKMFEKTLNSDATNYDNCWSLDEIGSAVIIDEVDDDKLYIITDKSLGHLCLKTGCFNPVVKLDLFSHMRANDGSVSPSGTFWFGSMEKKPTGKYGAIYSISPQGILKMKYAGIGIPNTFCWSKDGEILYLSDSLEQKMFKCHINANTELTLINAESPFINLSNTLATPDGGAIDSEGNLWNAQWGGSEVLCYSPLGDILHSIKLPVSQVSNCCFGGPKNKHLFITSARENLSEEKLSKWPLSGSTFVVELSVTGQKCNGFKMDLNGVK